MKLKKFTAIAMTIAMTATVFTACGNSEKESESKKESTKKEASAGSFAEIAEKTAKLENFSYEMDYDFSIKSSELETALSSDDEMGAIMESLGLKGDTIKGNISVDGISKGTDALQCKLSVELGSIKGTLTELIYVDDTLYVNVAEVVSLVENVAKKLDVDKEISAYLTLIPEGDYIAIPMDTLEEVADLFLVESGMTFDELMSSVSEEDAKKVQEAGQFIVKELEKIAKKAGAYSDKDGYVLTLTKDNMMDWIKSGVEVLIADMDDVYKNITLILGDEIEVTEDDLESIKDAYEELEKEDWDEMEKEFEDSMSEMDDLSLSISAKEDGDAYVYGVETSFGVDDVDVSFSMKYKISEDKDASVKAPGSVMSEEDVTAMLSLLGISSVDDLEGLVYGSTYDYSYDDYDYDDYDFDDYDYDDYDFEDMEDYY